MTKELQFNEYLKKRFINLPSIQNNKSFQTTNAVSVQFQNIHFQQGMLLKVIHTIKSHLYNF